MSETSLMSPNNDILTTPKESIKTPKFREFHEMIRSPKHDSLNTPLPLTTPLPNHDGLLSTPTLITPRTADWGLFSPINLGGSPCSSPRDPQVRDSRPSDLPLDSTIGLSSPHDGVLAKRRKLKNLNSSHSRSIESDSNSCDTPTGECEPRDLSKKSGERSRLASDSSAQDEEQQISPGQISLDRVRDKVCSVSLSSSPKWFKHPRGFPESLKLNKDLLSDLPSSYQQSPLAVPSPNWTTISAYMSSEGFALKTPKVLDNFVFDVLPPNTPKTPKIGRERSPEKFQPLNYEKQKSEDIRTIARSEGRVTFAEQPRPQSLTPPPPYPEDLSMPRGPQMVPKQEQPDNYKPPMSPPAYSPQQEDVKEEPRDYSNVPSDFPLYYLHPEIQPHQLYRQPVNRPASPPASPPRIPSAPVQPNLYQHAQAQRQFYNHAIHPGLTVPTMTNYESNGHGGPQYNLWGGGNHHPASEVGNQHVTMPTPSQALWRAHQGEQSHYSKPRSEPIKIENRLSTESQESLKKKFKTTQDSKVEGEDQAQDGQPPKKRGKTKGKVNDAAGPKRVFVCPHCQRSYDWNYNLNRHLKYECGKENSFMCSKCGRRFPHKQNCVYHLKRKHKIICETIDQYVNNGLVVFQGNPGAAGQTSPSNSGGYSPADAGGPQEDVSSHLPISAVKG